MTGESFFFELTELDDQLILEAQEQPSPRQRGRAWVRAALLAAVLLLLALTAGAALLRGSLDISPIQIQTGETGYVISFRATDDLPVELGSWYPTWLPEDMEMYMSTTDEAGYQVLLFRGQERMRYFSLSYAKMGCLPEECLTSVRSLEAVSVGDCPGYWIVDKTPILLWADRERGIVFRIMTVNLERETIMRIAESVSPTDYIPGRYQYEADAAQIKLGDYELTCLPDGYELWRVYGATCNPLINPRTYGYVHKLYQDDACYELHLYYEYTSLFEPSRVELPQGSREEITLMGQPAWLIFDQWDQPCAVSWEHTDSGGIRLLFTVKADHLSRERLLDAAGSLVCVTEANTDHFIR